jgi:hypothetical protein
VKLSGDESLIMLDVRKLITVANELGLEGKVLLEIAGVSMVPGGQGYEAMFIFEAREQLLEKELRPVPVPVASPIVKPKAKQAGSKFQEFIGNAFYMAIFGLLCLLGIAILVMFVKFAWSIF